MTVAKIIEITCASPTSFDEAIKTGVAKANETLKNVKSAWVADQTLVVENGSVTEYQVRLKVTFVLD
ncbi:MAG TPA: dodecin family protein [Thiolinea sp.]|nr:dodecin family protein [Thiolinea sp.]